MLAIRKNLTIILFVLIIISGLLPFLIIAIYNHPTIDDFYLANSVNELGFLKAQISYYKTWNGRFSSTLLMSIFNPLLFDNWLLGIKIYPIIFLTLLLFSIICVLRLLFKPTIGWSPSICLGVILLLAYLQKVEIISEFFYWFSCSFVYGISLIGLMVYFCLLGLFFSSGRFKSVTFISIIVVGVLLVGTNEITLVNTVLLHSVIIAYLFYTKNRKAKLFALAGVMIFVAAFLSVTAEGNMVRLNNTIFDPTVKAEATSLKGVILLTIKSIQAIFPMLKNWIANLPVLASGLLFSAFVWRYGSASKILIRSGKGILSYFLLIGLILALQLIPVLFGFGIVVNRVWNTVFFHFMVYWFFGLYLLIIYLREIVLIRIHVPANFIPYLLNSFLAIFLFLNLTSFHISNAWKDIFFKAPAYDKHYRVRYNYIETRKALGEKHLIVPPAFATKREYPQTIFYMELDTANSGYVNESFSKYFKLNSIKLTQAPN